MKKIFMGLILCALVAGPAFAGSFTVMSPQVKNHGNFVKKQEFNGFGCKGSNISPALRWEHAPAKTKSFAVTMYDQDAPTGSGWWHWVIFNIPANVTGLAKGAGDTKAGKAPIGSIQSRTDYGKYGYGGPCPPVGAKPHHYLITVYALKIKKLPLGKNVSAALVGYYLHQNMISKTVLHAEYSR